MNTLLGACPHDCPDTCSLLTHVESNRVIKVTGNPHHPPTDGVLCTKVARYPERLYHPERLTTPLRRIGPKGSGQFAPATWDEALTDIAQRLKTIAQTDPQAIVPYSYAGTMGLVQGEAMAGRFFNKIGASFLDRTICASAGGTAALMTLGAKWGMHVEQFEFSDVILIWGSNPITSSVHFWRIAMQAKRRGAKLICIDPRRSETADKCDHHIALLPGTDGALALGIMNELIQNDWLDHDYLARYTLGWSQLKERCLEWPAERAASVCGLTTQALRDLARWYGQAKHPAIRLNYGMQRAKGGGQAVRAVLCLPALVGAWRSPQAGLLLSSSGHFAVDAHTLQGMDLRQGQPPARIINMSTLGSDLLRDSDPYFGSKIQALVVYNSNPAAVAPNSRQVIAGLQREDLFTVVLEHFQTDTADYADWILPASMQMEHWDLHTSYGHTDVLLNQPAVTPPPQCLSNAAIFRRLAAAMGWTDACFQDDDETLCRQAFAALHMPDGSSFDALQKHGFLSVLVSASKNHAPFAEGHFPTPSGKCEFWSARLEQIGQDPLPSYEPNGDPPHPRYPLAMISPPERHFMNSSFANVASLQAIHRRPVVEIHPQDAQIRGLQTGDLIKVWNDRGVYHAHAEVSDRARVGVVVGLGVWWRKMGLQGTNVNELTSDALTDLGAAPVFYDCAVEVAKEASKID